MNCNLCHEPIDYTQMNHVKTKERWNFHSKCFIIVKDPQKAIKELRKLMNDLAEFIEHNPNWQPKFY